MSKSIKIFLRKLFNKFIIRICKKEFENQTFSRFNERPVEYCFVFRIITENYPRSILDVGTGTTALPHLMRNCGSLVTAIDNIRDYWPDFIINRHYYVLDDDITKTRLNQKFDLITCISVLEHIIDFDTAVGNMLSLLKSGGFLILTFPYNEKKYVKNVYDLEKSRYGQGSSYITQAFSKADVDRWIQNNKCCLVEQEYWQYWSGDYWTVGEQIIPPKKVNSNERHQITCICLKKNEQEPSSSS